MSSMQMYLSREFLLKRYVCFITTAFISCMERSYGLSFCFNDAICGHNQAITYNNVIGKLLADRFQINTQQNITRKIPRIFFHISNKNNNYCVSSQPMRWKPDRSTCPGQEQMEQEPQFHFIFFPTVKLTCQSASKSRLR